MTTELLPVVEAAREALEGRESVVGDAAAGEAPRFELFHAAGSICSQKVRCVLAHHRIAYVSRPVSMFLGQTYLPAYVRLRMIGCERFGGALAAHHGGTTAAETGGCDGVVVPTLVDWASGEVIVDSKRICLHLDAQAPEAQRLRPAALAGAIDGELAIVDNLPNYQMLMGRTSGAAEGGAAGGEALAAFSRRKVAWCDRYLAECGDDDVLARAYAAKRAKEQSAADELFSPEAMRAAYAIAEAAVAALDRKLAARDGWLFGPDPTLADLFWGIELLRMKDVGVASVWEGGRLARVERFAAATEALPAIRSAIVDWPEARF